MGDTVIVLICAAVLLVSVLLIALLVRDHGPKYRPVPIMTPNELEFFWRLSKAVPEAFVFPQVTWCWCVSWSWMTERTIPRVTLCVTPCSTQQAFQPCAGTPAKSQLLGRFERPSLGFLNPPERLKRKRHSAKWHALCLS